MAGSFTFLDLELFVYLAEESSLAKAATRAAISPSAASARVLALERYAGTKLWKRSGNDVLTHAGKQFLEYARETLAMRQEFGVKLQFLREEKAGILRISGNESIMIGHLPDVLDRLQHTHSNVLIELHTAYLSAVVSAVANGTADIGLIISPILGEGLQMVPYKNERIVAALPYRHPLASHQLQGISLEELAHYDLIGYHPVNHLHQILDVTSQEFGITLRFKARVSNFDVACSLAAYTTIGIALVPESVAYRNTDPMPLRVIPITDPWANIEFSMCAQDFADLSSAGAEFVRLMKLRFPKAR